MKLNDFELDSLKDKLFLILDIFKGVLSLPIAPDTNPEMKVRINSLKNRLYLIYKDILEEKIIFFSS